MSLDKFLGVLFDPGAATCFAGGPHGHKVRPVFGDWAHDEHNLFFSINSLHLDKDLGASQDWHRPFIGRRADCNVACFRSFLIELDWGTETEQRAYLASLELPFSSLVYSGSKSLHAIVSLVDPVSADEYRHIAQRLHKLCTKADPSTKNPSRLSRLPFRVRPETGRMQELLYLGSRIKNEDLLARLPELPKRAQLDKVMEPARLSVALLGAILNPDQTMQEFNLRGRNQFYYWMGRRMDEAGVLPDKRTEYVESSYGNLKDVSGFSLREAKMAARCK